jgi:hypothetical protein
LAQRTLSHFWKFLIWGQKSNVTSCFPWG